MEALTLKITGLFLLLHLFDTLAYSIRLNAVKSGRFALSTSLFNTISLATRISSTFLLPSIGLLIGWSMHHKVDPIWQMRQILFGATLGAVIGSAFIPTFLRLFGKAVKHLEETGSIPGLIMQSLSLESIRRISRNAAMPRRQLLSGLRFRQIPKRLLITNVVITGIYTVGILAANYAALLVPSAEQFAVVQSSGIINGVATILLSLFVDPKSATITDQAMRGERPYGDVKALVTLLILTKIIGTLLAQLIFLPSADLIALIFR